MITTPFETVAEREREIRNTATASELARDKQRTQRQNSTLQTVADTWTRVQQMEGEKKGINNESSVRHRAALPHLHLPTDTDPRAHMEESTTHHIYT
jgi:hypothetical protein